MEIRAVNRYNGRELIAKKKAKMKMKAKMKPHVPATINPRTVG